MIQLVFDANDAARRSVAIRSRLATARTREPSARPGTTTSSRSWTGRDPSSTPLPARTPNKYSDALWLGSSAEAGVGCDDTQGPHRELSPRVATIPSDSGGRRGRISVDRVRGTVGRAAEGLLQRPDRPEPEDAMDEADHVVRGLARPELRGADRRRVRHRDDRLLLLGGRERLASARRTSSEPVPLIIFLATILGLVIFAAVRATWTPVAPTRGSPDAGRGARSSRPRRGCTSSAGPLPRAWRTPHPDRGRDHLRAVASARGVDLHRHRLG